MTDGPEQLRADALPLPDETGPHDTTLLSKRHGKRKARRSANEPDQRAPEPDAETTASAPLTLIKERFQLESMLGSGGMGTVYKARDLRKVEARDRDPWVAIKLLSDDFKDHPSALIALQREARKSQALTHANIVKVFDFDRDADTVYMTMELLRGNDLSHYIGANPAGVSVEQVAKLTRQIGDALRHAHGAGIVHADLTPRNVFLTSDGTAKVLDFGIAQAVADADLNESIAGETAFNPASLGGLTPAYASLQRLDGEQPVPADDIYGLGCIVYELLSGAHPTRGRSVRDAVERKLRPHPIGKLNRRQWRALAKALAVRREDRYTDVGKFLSDFVPEKRAANRYAAGAVAAALLLAGAVAWQVYEARDAQRASAAELAARQEALTLSQQSLVREREQATRQTGAELARNNEEYLDSAVRLIQSRQFDAADEFLKRVAGSDPGMPRLLELQVALAAARRAEQEQRRNAARVEAEIEQLSEKIDRAIAAGRLLKPRADSAYAYYRQVLALDGGEGVADRALQRLLQLQTMRVESAIASGRLAAAEAGLEDLATLSADNPNLGRLREDVRDALVNRQQIEGRVLSLLSRAGDAEGPEEKRDLYLQALSIDPGNEDARDGLNRAREEIARSDREKRGEAQSLLDEARGLLAPRPVEAAKLQQAHALLLRAKGLGVGLPALDALLEGFPARYRAAIEDRMAARDYVQAEKLTQAAIVLSPGDEQLASLRDELVQRLAGDNQPVIPVSF